MTANDPQLDLIDTCQKLLEQLQPGAALKLMRDAQGVTLASISAQTLIPEWKLSGLESDEYERLGANIFVIGYIRKVAKILDIESDSFVQAFEQSLAQNGAKGAAAASNKEYEPSSIGKYANPIGPRNRKSGVLRKINKIPGPAAVAGLLIVWGTAVWLMKYTATLQSPALEPAVVAGGEAVPSETSMLEAPKNTLETNDAIPSALDDVTTAAGGELASGQPADFESEATSVTMLDTRVDTALSTEEAQSTESVSTAVRNPSVDVPIASQTQGEDLLSMTFSADCWVKVSDANGTVVFAQLQRTGDNLQLFGEAPFNVLLGDARAADVLINGNPVAINPIPGDKTLRFTVQP